MSKLTKS